MQSSAYHLPIITGVILIRTQISIANSSPFFASLAAMTTSYPLIAKYCAICESIPPVAPVTTAISRLGGCRYRRPLFHDHSPFSRSRCPRRGLAAGTSQRRRDRRIILDWIELSGNWVFITPTCHPSRPTLTADGPGV